MALETENLWQLPYQGISENQDEFESYRARIVVIGAGGAGNNTITRLSTKGILGAKTIAVNTDARQLAVSKADEKILIGKELTKGLGAGGYPSIGKKAAEESKSELKAALEHADMVFVTCGLGGGTGTGASPVIARIAREQGAIVIGTVTLPFKIEGARISKAEEGLAQLREVCDTVIVMENQRLLSLAGNLPLKDAFAMADDLIATMIKGISETISQPSLVNLDYADVKTIMKSGGVAAIGVGESSSESRAREAVMKALNHPLLEIDYSGATGALIQIVGGENLRLDEVNEIGEAVSKHLDPEAQVIWGARILPEFEDKVQVITIVTGVKSPYILGPMKKEELAKELTNQLGIEVIR
ncbi:MAG: cell division protein FtsZ [Candidatus Aenigmatarchaeota archaeon]